MKESHRLNSDKVLSDNIVTIEAAPVSRVGQFGTRCRLQPLPLGKYQSVAHFVIVCLLGGD